MITGFSNGVIDNWCDVFWVFGPKGPKTVGTELGDLEIFEEKK